MLPSLFSASAVLVGGVRVQTRAGVVQEAQKSIGVVYKCETVPTFAADPNRACARIPGKAACFSTTPDVFWSCAGSVKGPNFVDGNHCDHKQDPDGNPYNGACLHEGHARYGDALDWDGGAAWSAALDHTTTQAPSDSGRRRHDGSRRRHHPIHERSRLMEQGWHPHGQDGHGISNDAMGWQTNGSTVGKGFWCEVGFPASGWSPGSSDCPAQVGDPLEVRVLTYNLFWWKLFGVDGGRHGSAGHVIRDNGPFDMMGFQECERADRVIRDAGLSHEFHTYSPTNAIAIAWNHRVWNKLEKGYADVAEDSHLQWYGSRSAVWARLQHRDTGKTVFLINHHGPLPTQRPGGVCGPHATAYNILKVIGERAHKGDAVFLIGDFNAKADSPTFSELGKYLTLAYRGRSFNGVDDFFTNCGEVRDTHNLGKGGSDHDALSVTFGVY